MDARSNGTALREKLIVWENASPGGTLKCDVCLEAVPLAADLCIAGGFRATVYPLCLKVALGRATPSD